MTELITDIRDGIMMFQSELLADGNHRYLSWEHCFIHFQQHRFLVSDEAIDRATLQLAFFLASWGMYRGSSELLQKDYRVHEPTVRTLLDARYGDLWDLNPYSLDPESPKLDKLFELVDELRKIYGQAGVSATDTLITKILLATLCCTPAYDTFFSDGVKAWRDSQRDSSLKFPAKFGRNSYLGLIEFYRRSKEVLDSAQAEIAQTRFTYPIMKLIDMYFWNLGYQSR